MKYFLLLFLLASHLFTTGQDKKLTMYDAVIGQWRELYPENLTNIQWCGNTNSFTFQDYYNIYQQNIKSSDTTVLLSLNELNKITTLTGDTLEYIPSIKWANDNILYFYTTKNLFAINYKKRSILFSLPLPPNAENKHLFYNKKTVAYTIDNNLYITDTTGKSFAITADTNKNIVNGQSVSRNEFGITGGVFWSPQGNFIAFYRKDESDVKEYPLVDITKREAEVEFIKYPMAGMKSEHISLGIFNLKTKKTIFIENSPKSEQYLTNITWGLKEEYIYIQVLNREQNHMKLNQYSVKSGNLSKTIIEETNKKYVEPEHKLIFSSKNKFIFLSRNNGYNHAFLYNTNGKLIKQLTTGNWEITEVINVINNNMYYISTESSPIERQLYKINLTTGKKIRLTQKTGTHKIHLNPNGKYYIDVFSNIETPNIVSIYETNGNKVRTIIKAKNPLSDYNIPKMEIGTIKSADNKTDLYYRLIRPSDFNPKKRYPVIVYVYGGPHAQLVKNQWLGGARLWDYYMAQKGYIIFTVDNRGSANRGLKFENVIHRQCGVNEMEDQVKGVDFLLSKNYVDKNRIGVFGWSYGGFMTTSLIVNYPNIFKVGVAGGPVIDWKYYEVMYGERYMDTPQENPEGYLFTSLIPRAKDLKGKLLIIHGAIDNTVVWQHSQLFIRECIKNNVPVDYFIYPRAEHNVHGFDRIHLMSKVSEYFDDNL